MGCRFFGRANDPRSYWELFCDGRDAIIEVPPERWDIDAYFDPDPDAPGKLNVRSGGFLEDLDRFEPAFFQISPREARSLDPQQRLLLEVTWEALEHAGIDPERLMKSQSGVFIGMGSHDYEVRAFELSVIDAYSS